MEELTSAIEEVNLEKQQEDEDDASDKEDFSGWVDDEEDNGRVKSLFGNTLLDSVEKLVEHDKKVFHFDLMQMVKEVCTDDFSFIKLINFIRSFSSSLPLQQLDIPMLEELIRSKAFLEDETYLKPVLEDDPLLFLYEELFQLEGTEDTLPVKETVDEELPTVKEATLEET
jgi:type I protein arginine methyltransferase